MNVPFTLEKSELEAEFIKEADKENIVQLKGHRIESLRRELLEEKQTRNAAEEA
ncbi:hypothetical protein ACJW31_02G214500 [Castanea mollissima]